MKRIYFIVVLFVIACGDAGNNEASNTADTSKPVTLATDTTVKKSSPPSRPYIDAPWMLTEEEKGDDSIFADRSQPTSWENAGITDPAAAKKFVKELKHYILRDVRDSLGEAIQYPLKNPELKDIGEYFRTYDKYINEKVQKAILNQNLRQIFRNNKGAMIGNGEIWFRQTKSGFKIVAINFE